MAKLRDTDLHIAEGYAREIESAYRGKTPAARVAAADELRDIAAQHPHGEVLRGAADRLATS